MGAEMLRSIAGSPMSFSKPTPIDQSFTSFRPYGGSNRHNAFVGNTQKALRSSLALAFLLLPQLHAQPTPGSITTQPLPLSGPLIADAAGNWYGSTDSRATPGAAQVKPGGGNCELGGGFFPTFEPCSD